MKKKGSKKKVNSSKRRKKFFFFNSKVSVFILVFVFLALAFLLPLVNTGNAVNASITGHQTETNFISDFFAKWSGGNLDINIAKWLVFITVTMLITSVLAFVGFPPYGALQFFLGLVVSFLATAYITPEEVFVMLTSYTALGLTIGSIMPFVIMIFTSAMLVSHEKIRGMSAGKLVLEVALWFLWSGFLIYKLIMLWVDQGFNVLLRGGGLVMGVVFIASVLILIFNKPFRKFLRGLGVEVIRSKAEVQREERVQERESERQSRRR